MTCNKEIGRKRAKSCLKCGRWLCGKCSHGNFCQGDFQSLELPVQKKVKTTSRIIHLLDKSRYWFIISTLPSLIIGLSLTISLSSLHPGIELVISSIIAIPLSLKVNQIFFSQKRHFFTYLNAHSVRVIFPETSPFTCDVCQTRTVAMHGARLDSPFKCFLCAKILCSNCNNNGFCPDHTKRLTSEDKAILTKLKSESPLLINFIIFGGLGLILGLFISLFIKQIIIVLWLLAALMGFVAFLVLEVILLVVKEMRNEKIITLMRDKYNHPRG
jgi:hypothetical protein